MRIVLVRHTPVNLPDGTCYGRSDVELSPDWSQHFKRTRAKLPHDALAAGWVYSSPLRRCLDLASSLADEVVADDRLREMDFGHWELTPWSEIPEQEVRRWADDILNTSPPGGENLTAMSQRCAEFCDELCERQHESAIVVTHGGVIRCMIAKFLGMHVPNALKFRIDFGSVTQVRIAGGVVQVEYVNR